jgi:hypothetical protein
MEEELLHSGEGLDFLRQSDSPIPSMAIMDRHSMPQSKLET